MNFSLSVRSPRKWTTMFSRRCTMWKSTIRLIRTFINGTQRCSTIRWKSVKGNSFIQSFIQRYAPCPCQIYRLFRFIHSFPPFQWKRCNAEPLSAKPKTIMNRVFQSISPVKEMPSRYAPVHLKPSVLSKNF